MSSCKMIFYKYKSFIFYVLFGVLTTCVNILCYYIFSHILSFNTIISNVFAWVFAVLFAYITNKKCVFESKANSRNAVIKEIFYFFSCRLATGFLDIGIMYFFVDIMQMNDMVIKIISNVMVIAVNYILSKIIIFKN